MDFHIASSAMQHSCHESMFFAEKQRYYTRILRNQAVFYQSAIANIPL
jgi:hypothetical protein